MMNNEQLLMRQLRSPRTINEAIQRIFESDQRTGRTTNRNWKFYVHLNKLPAQMKRKGLIDIVDTVKGPTNRTEKVWVTL